MLPHLMTTFANGLLMGKILASCLFTIPIRLTVEDRSFIGITEEINKAIKLQLVPSLESNFQTKFGLRKCYKKQT